MPRIDRDVISDGTGLCKLQAHDTATITCLTLTIFAITLLLGILLMWSLIAERMATTPITGPMVMVAGGLLIAATGAVDPYGAHQTAHLLAELTLVIVLFSDAARINLKSLLGANRQPVQMLAFGLPGAVLAGILAGSWLFPELGFWSIALLAAILAPTDAALGDAVVSSESVPELTRQTLSVESGLNDGLVVPMVLMLACGANISHNVGSASQWLALGAQQIGFGAVAGLLVGYVGAKLVRMAMDTDTLGQSWQGIASLALAGLAWSIAELIHGNGFVSAFLAGLIFGNQLQRPAHFLYEFSETEGRLLVLATFALFGAVLLPEVLPHIDGRVLLYALLSLTLVRMLPVLLSLSGSGSSWSERFFLAWFGPRGLASILFILLVGESGQIPQYELLTTIVFTTVALSIVLHGATAGPLSTIYGGHRSAANPSVDPPVKDSNS